MAEHVLELERGADYGEGLLPALREFVATSPPGEYRLVVRIGTTRGAREVRFAGLIAEPDANSLEAIVAEHRLVGATPAPRGNGEVDQS